MTAPVRLAVRAAWLGFALAAIFFYPLVAALDSDPYYLQWQPAHTYEAGAAMVLIAIVLAGLLYAVLPRSSRRATVALGLITLVPLLSLGAGLSRQLPIDDELKGWWENPAIRFGVPAAVGLLVAAAFAFAPAAFNRGLQKLLLVLSPISFVVVIGLAGSTSGPGAITAVNRLPAGAAVPADQCPSIVALLFDELSFAYLYDGGNVRADYPAFRAFAGGATNYLNVRAPGDETMISVPGYLAARAFDNIRVEGTELQYEVGSERAPFVATQPEGLFATARRVGFSPEIAGYYFPYCEMLGTLTDVCRSFSFYNISNASTGFSPLHPVVTTFVLWPRQFPLGLFKKPPFARLQRALVEATTAFAARPLDGARPTFRFVHFSIPHLPFAFGPDGYDPPFNPLLQRPDTHYARQVQYSDRLFGELMAGMRTAGAYDRTTIVVFSDHGFRSGGRETNSRHVPFIVKRAGQSAREEIAGQIGGEQLLRQLVAEGCSAQS